MDPLLASQLARLPRLNPANVLAGAVPCKVCDNPAPFFDVVDFNKCAGGYAFGQSGICVPWHRCDDCGFLFTPFFDDWSPQDFSQFIYNQDYTLLDPDYLSARPRRTAERISRLLAGFEDARILDYGAGANVFAARMKDLGFAHVESFDPFSHPTRPDGKFDIVTCIEVIEHAPSPHAIVADMHEFLAREGCILIGESLQPPDIGKLRCGWWYVAPRNGHVSIYTARTLAKLADRAGMIFHRGTGHPHLLRNGTWSAKLAARCGPPLAYVRLCAPGRSPAKGFSGVEGAPGRQFQWTTEPEISWTIDVPDSGPCFQIMVPFAHQSRPGFVATCVLEVNGQVLATTIQERSVFAETAPLAPGQARVTLRTGPPTAGPTRAIGLAIATGRSPDQPPIEPRPSPIASPRAVSDPLPA